VLLLLAAGCSGTISSSGDSTGSLALDLTVSGDFEIDEVLWKISGGTQGMPDMDGTIDTSAPGSTASVEVFGLPEDTGYLIDMVAKSTDGEPTCSGSAGFDVTVGEATPVHVMLNCKYPERFGGVRVDGKFNSCPELTKVVVSPLQTSVGHAIDLYSNAVDTERDPIAYLWTSERGSIAEPLSAAATYTCTEVTNDTIRISVTDDEGANCMAMWDVDVTCVDGVEEDTEFNPEYCDTVKGTLNIHWEAVGGPYAPCVGIETTDGVVPEALDGTAAFQGVSVSDPACIGMDIYEFMVSQDGLTLNGTAYASAVDVEMVFTRLANEACFVGHWILNDQDYVGHIAAEPFGVVVSR
jgi:hypothetical protein